MGEDSLELEFHYSKSKIFIDFLVDKFLEYRLTGGE